MKHLKKINEDWRQDLSIAEKKLKKLYPELAEECDDERTYFETHKYKDGIYMCFCLWNWKEDEGDVIKISKVEDIVKDDYMPPSYDDLGIEITTKRVVRKK